MSSPSLSRRRFLTGSAGTFGSGWLALNWPAIVRAAEHAQHAVETSAANATSFTHLELNVARDIEALAARIIPRTETAGARETGVVHFIDRALTTFFAMHAEEFAAGFETLAHAVTAKYGAGVRYADLDDAAQLELTAAIAGSPFFEAMRLLTILGFLALPGYGGNRERLGWSAVGFTDEHAFAPPFGHYDRDYPGFEPYSRPDQEGPE